MATIQQIDDLHRFASELPEQVRGELTIEEIVENWKKLDHQEIAAISKALASYDQGDRGRPMSDFLAEFHAKREASNH